MRCTDRRINRRPTRTGRAGGSRSRRRRAVASHHAAADTHHHQLRRARMFSDSFLLANGALLAVQAALVVLPGRGLPGPLRRLRADGWAFVAPACVAALVLAASL